MARDSKLWESAYKHYLATTQKEPKEHPVKIKQKREYKETMILQEDLIKVNKELQQLRKKKRTILAQMKRQHIKPIRSQYYEKEIFLYVLELEDNCYYIGMSRNVEKRFKAHLKGSAGWTKKHKPISIIAVKPTGTNSDSEASVLEDDLTLEYALKYGSDYVRGGGYCQSKPRWPDVVLQNELFT